jgi:hypothetical protein
MRIRSFAIGVRLCVFCGVSVFLGVPVAASPAPGSAADSCRSVVLAAGVGSSASSGRVWVPQIRQFNLQIGTPEVTVRLGGQNNALSFQIKVPSVALFNTNRTSIWTGNNYQGVARTVTFGPWTWTDRGVPLGGVCVAYDSVVEEIREEQP